MPFKRFVILISIIIVSFNGISQQLNSLKDNLFVEIDYGYGSLLPHHNTIKYFVEDRINTLDIKISKQTFGNKYWNQLYRYPYYGIGFYRSNLGNDDVYGFVNALYSYLKVPILGKSNGLNLSYQIAFGMSYMTEIFSIEDNYENLAIGSHVNIYIDFSLQSSIPLTKRLSLNNSLRLTHFSNGRMKSPNKGLNILSGSVGLQYQLNNSLKERKIIKLPEIDEINEFSVIYAAGSKTLSRYDNQKYFISSIIFDYNRNYSLKRRWRAGADFFYDESNKTMAIKENGVNSSMDPYLFSLHAGHDLVLGNFCVAVDLGAYIYAEVEQLAPFFTRIGLRYRVNKKYIANLTLKSHYAKASFIEWGVGYVF